MAARWWERGRDTDGDWQDRWLLSVRQQQVGGRENGALLSVAHESHVQTGDRTHVPPINLCFQSLRNNVCRPRHLGGLLYTNIMLHKKMSSIRYGRSKSASLLPRSPILPVGSGMCDVGYNEGRERIKKKRERKCLTIKYIGLSPQPFTGHHCRKRMSTIL